MSRCERCGGQVFLERQPDGTDDAVCLQCGRRETLGWQPAVLLPKQREPIMGRSHKKKVSV